MDVGILYLLIILFLILVSIATYHILDRKYGNPEYCNVQSVNNYVKNTSAESMRDATTEELQSTNDYVESISSETGVDFYSVTANDFKHIPGENDAEYIRLLEKAKIGRASCRERV